MLAKGIHVGYAGQAGSENLYLTGLPPAVTETELCDFFAMNGFTVKSAKPLAAENGIGSSAALVQLASLKEAISAISALDGRSWQSDWTGGCSPRTAPRSPFDDQKAFNRTRLRTPTPKDTSYTPVSSPSRRRPLPASNSHVLSVQYSEVGGSESCNLLISGLPSPSVEQALVSKMFAAVGLRPARLRLLPDSFGAGISGAMVEMGSTEDAAAAIQFLNGKAFEELSASISSSSRGQAGSKQLKEGSLDEVLRAFEDMGTKVVGQCRQLVQAALDVDAQAVAQADEVITRADEVLLRLHETVANARHHVLEQRWRNSSHTRKEETDMWENLFSGKRKLRLQEVFRRVKLEAKIVLAWKRRSETFKGGLSASGSSRKGLDDGVESSISNWDEVDVFHIEQQTKRPLTQIWMSIWLGREFGRLCSHSTDDAYKFIKAVEDRYVMNPYHNRMHAADVTHAAGYLWLKLSQQDVFQGYFTKLDLLVIIVAAAIHDMAHPAVNNDFLVKTNNPLALRYNDRSVLENYHAACGFELMQELNVRILEHNLPSPPTSALRARVIDIVLATDMAEHKSVVDNMQAQIELHVRRQDVDKLALERHLVHMCDISHPLRKTSLHQEWTRRLTEEFYAQGDREKELGLVPMALLDRDKGMNIGKSQLGFVNFVILPTWKALAPILGESAEPLDRLLHQNIALWEARAEEDERKESEAG